MVRHDLQSMPVGEYVHEQGVVVADMVAYDDRFREQMLISERLHEYYNEVVAEIRASLERAEAEGW